MGTAFLRFMGALLFSLPEGSVRLDVAPPPTLLAGIGLVALAGLCLFVLAIGIVAFFVIRAVKKNRTVKDNPPAPTNTPTAPNP
jgi:heme/copper-type cytochrome/quinol oxidase subunit 2